MKRIAEQRVGDVSRTIRLHNIDALREDNAWDLFLGSPVPIWETNIVSGSQVCFTFSASEFSSNSESFLMKNLFQQDKVGSVPRCEDHTAGSLRRVSTVFLARVDDSALRILPRNKWPSVDTAYLEVALVVCFGSILDRLHSEDKHVEDIWVVLAEQGDWSPFDYSVWNSNNSCIARIVGSTVGTVAAVSAVTTPCRVSDGRIRVGAIGVGGVGIGGIRIGSIGAGRIGIGSIRIGRVGVRSVRISGIRIRSVRIGGIRVGSVWVRSVGIRSVWVRIVGVRSVGVRNVRVWIIGIGIVGVRIVWIGVIRVLIVRVRMIWIRPT